MIHILGSGPWRGVEFLPDLAAKADYIIAADGSFAKARGLPVPVVLGTCARPSGSGPPRLIGQADGDIMKLRGELGRTGLRGPSKGRPLEPDPGNAGVGTSPAQLAHLGQRAFSSPT